ncbi:rRNA pseudouridine synthase, partial [Candidatus Peregrinibacteria bacterium]|nr:rRNA pseudouridine synthase [Candidatus Peregrinibacteria bacterium]
PEVPRVFPVGRLDKETTGLLLLTNDGRMTYDLTHPSKEHEKEYEVKVSPDISNGALEKLKGGISILGEKTRPTIINRLSKNSFGITLTEGKNRHIRRICRKVGVEVVALKRVRIGSFIMKNIELGKYRVLDQNAIKLLKSI